MKSLLISLIVFSFQTIVLVGYAQDFNLNMNIKPLPPEAASLGKYQITPVGHYTGIPRISIPLYTVQGRTISFPIELSYHAAGIKVEEMASMVGLGWSMTGAAVTRQARHMPDDFSNVGFLNATYKPSTFEADLATTLGVQRMKDALGFRIDLEPDIFAFSFNGYSGEFFFDEDGKYHFKSQQDLKIQIVRASNGMTINGWIITTPDGTKYYFGTSRDGNRLAIENQATVAVGVRTDPPPPGASSWYLLDILDCNESDQINFFYKDFTSVVCSYGTETRVTDRPGDETCLNNPSTLLSFIESTGTHKLIDSIYSVNGAIKFAKRTPRLDFVGSNRLDQILIYNSERVVIKTYDFTYSYFNATGNKVFTDCHIVTDEQMKRLKLESVTESNGQGKSNPSYKFTYNTTPLPSRFSKSVDYWGYYNGASNTTLVPAISLLAGNNVVFFDGANRTPNPSYSQAALLRKIEYPTGGTTEFVYEQNKVFTSSATQLPGVTESRLVAITDTNVATKTDDIRINDNNLGYVWFNYEFTNTPRCEPNTRGCDLYFQIKGLGSQSSFFYEERFWTGRVRLPNGNYRVTVFDALTGFNFDRFEMRWQEVPPQEQNQGYAGGVRVAKITTKPAIGVPSVVKYEYNLFNDVTKSSGVLTGYPLSGYQHRDHECGRCPSIVRTSTSNYPLSTTQGSYVGYQHVKEIYGENGENGRTEMEFSFSSDDDAAALNFPFPPANTFEVLRGDLLKKRMYTAAGQLIRQEEFMYNPQSNPSAFHYYNVFGYKIVNTRNGACYARYNTTGFWKFLESQVTTSFSDGIPNVETVEYKYDNINQHVMPNREIRNNSDGTTTTLRKAYAPDGTGTFTYAMDAALLAAKNSMVTRFKISQPLEEIMYKGTTPINKIRRDFLLSDSKIFPKATWTAESGGSYSQIVSIDQLDSYGNIRQLTRRTAAPEAYVWSSDGSELLAAVTNATSDQIYYQDFEGIGTIGEARTGRRYYSGSSFTIPASSRPTGSDLLMTFWYYDGTWKLAEDRPYNSIVSMVGATRMDDIRVFPRGSQVTTYSYKPGVGVSSITDANNQTSYYSYDDMNRLQMIRDDKGSILKTFEYNYAVVIEK